MEQVAGNVGLFEGQPGAQFITMRPDLSCRGDTSSPGRCCCGALSKEGRACPSCQGRITRLAGKAHKVGVDERLRDIPEPEVRVKLEKVRFESSSSTGEAL